MNSILEYKGYHTKVEFDFETMSLHGKIEGINDYVDFVCEDLKNVETEFHSVVDDYIEFCKEAGKEPEKEYKGCFNVRISPELHKQMALCAFKNNRTLNAEVEDAIKEHITGQLTKTAEPTEKVRDLTAIRKMDSSKAFG